MPLNDAVLLTDDDTIAEEDMRDDGFDSETTRTVTPPEDHDYYNTSLEVDGGVPGMDADSTECIPMKQLSTTAPAAVSGSTQPPLRLISESLGSMDTDTSDHDYYNELPVITAEQVHLNPWKYPPRLL